MPESRHRRRHGGNAPGGRSATGARLAVGSRRKRTNYFILIVSGVIAILVIGSFAATGIPGLVRGRSSQVGDSDRYVEGIGQQHATPLTTPKHVDPKTVTYSTTPPTSGDHWSNWASCGFYENGLEDERVVHNLEHGAVVISYNLTSPEAVKQLRNAVDDTPLSKIWGVTRLYDKIPEGTVAIVAWGVPDTMEGVDSARIKKFYETYAGKLGPEKSDIKKSVGIPC